MSDTLYLWLARALVLCTAMPIHECAHGYMANRLGDPTAREQGRLTLNPLKHLDLFGSILLLVSGFGWAKPVPVDPRYFRKPKRDMALTALAGPLANILLAFAAMILYKALYVLWPALRTIAAMQYVVFFLGRMLEINLCLAVFNLLPIPPLDGSKILGFILPDRAYFAMMKYERYIAGALFLLLFFTDLLNRPLGFLINALYGVLDVLTRPIEWIL